MGELSVMQPRGLRLETMADYVSFGRFVAETEFAPKSFRGRPADCTMAVIHGMEIGLTPAQALQSIAVVNGKPSVYGDTAMALVRNSPVCEAVDEGIEGTGDNRAAFCTVTRRGEKPQTRVFSVADAKRAKLWGKTGPWQDYPDRMLQMRARGFALRDVFPDILRGLVTREEAADYQTPAEPIVVRPVFPPKAVDPSDDFDRFKAEAAQESRPARPAGGSLVSQAKGAIEKATTLSELEDCRQRIEQHAQAGHLTADQVQDLVTRTHAKAEAIIASAEQAAGDSDESQAMADGVTE